MIKNKNNFKSIPSIKNTCNFNQDNAKHFLFAKININQQRSDSHTTQSKINIEKSEKASENTHTHKPHKTSIPKDGGVESGTGHFGHFRKSAISEVLRERRPWRLAVVLRIRKAREKAEKRG